MGNFHTTQDGDVKFCNVYGALFRIRIISLTNCKALRHVILRLQFVWQFVAIQVRDERQPTITTMLDFVHPCFPLFIWICEVVSRSQVTMECVVAAKQNELVVYFIMRNGPW